MFYYSLENGDNDVAKWRVQITGGFYDENKEVFRSLKREMKGTDMESFLYDRVISKS